MPRRTFSELYRSYRQEGAPRWAYILTFLLLMTGAVWFFFKGPPCIAPLLPCSECSKQSPPAGPERPKILRVF